ncbi:DNA-directed RNA polymerase subunit omega, partial [Vogesella mureinivorans]|uniref:DNA-directed RNA polymerase subunit omega n=1 Tax=Vogesella mureinivorans TaxID=657276 RepID=UPI0023EF516A
VLVASKRARQLARQGIEPTVEWDNDKPNTLSPAKVELEDDPHRAALEDNPTTQPKTGARVWIAIFVRKPL